MMLHNNINTFSRSEGTFAGIYSNIEIQGTDSVTVSGST